VSRDSCQKSTMAPVMVAMLMIVYGNENREAAADADKGYGKDDGGENLFHGASE